MKTLFIIALLASPCLANGPKYSQKDPLLQDEFENLYKDIGNATKKGIRGTTTNNSAAAGYVGEYIAVYNTPPNNFPATTVFGDGTSIALTPGDWDVTAVLHADVKGTTTTQIIMGISTNPGNNGTGLGLGDNELSLGTPPSTALQFTAGCIANYRVSISATTTYYLKVYAAFTGTGPQYGCRLSARRIR